MISLIRSYQWLVSPLLGLACRFEPSCSHYARGAIEQHGALVGVRLGVGRVLRCQPFSRGGYDPVPPVAGSEAAGRQDATPKGS